MNYEEALKLKEQRFPQSLHAWAEYYITPTIVMLRRDIHLYMRDINGDPVATNYFVYKPRKEEVDNWNNNAKMFNV